MRTESEKDKYFRCRFFYSARGLTFPSKFISRNRYHICRKLELATCQVEMSVSITGMIFNENVNFVAGTFFFAIFGKVFVCEDVTSWCVGTGFFLLEAIICKMCGSNWSYFLR